MKDTKDNADSQAEKTPAQPDKPGRFSAESEAYADGSRIKTDHTKLLKIMGAILLASFIFGWGSIPLYRLVCAKIAGGGSSSLNGEVSEYGEVEVDESRDLRVRFTTVVNGALPWDFDATERTVELHPGQKHLTHFKAHNKSSTDAIIGKAVYDIVPAQAAPYFKKIQCFCFDEQILGPNESVEMPLYFWFEPDMPKNINSITISYTFFKVGNAPDDYKAEPAQTAKADQL